MRISILFCAAVHLLVFETSAQCTPSMHTLSLAESEAANSVDHLNQNFGRLANCVQMLLEQNRTLTSRLNALQNENRRIQSALNDSLSNVQAENAHLLSLIEELKTTRLGNLRVEQFFSSGSSHTGSAQSDGLVIASIEAMTYGTQGSLFADTIDNGERERVSSSSISWTDQTRMRFNSVILPVREGQQWEIIYKSDIGNDNTVSLRTLWLSFATQ